MGTSGGNANFMVDQKKAVPEAWGRLLQGAWDMSHPDGPHPGRSSADEARFRMLIITSIVRRLLEHAGLRPHCRLVEARPAESAALAQLAQALDADPRRQEPDTSARQRWLLAAQSMPHHHSLATSWPALRRGLSDASVLQQYRSQLTRHDPDTWSFHRLDDDALAELYTLLLDDDSLARLQRHPQLGIQPDDRLVDLLQHLPRLLASRATPSAAAALRRLAQTHPSVSQPRVYARATARAAADRDALPLEPEQLIRLATDTQTRLVRDARQLLDLVRESLSAMQEDLQGYNGTAVNLWNRDRSRFEANTRCWPCWEDDLSDAVASFLRRDIGGHRVVVNREVQVRRTGLPGLSGRFVS
jgi:hypothetical protein